MDRRRGALPLLLAGAGAVGVVAGLVSLLSRPVSFGWFAYQEIEAYQVFSWADVVGPIAICLGAALLAVGGYLLGRRSRDR
ncbi:hypothetical protein AVL62_06355 [Serinicoccus chungangensis]|uniref:Uncharacterized protein n=1 Tax=Serinicoccus chungangensis TaxID=767452 RepID=A0A0W8IGX3_9MICO|nr:hypothetical protein [Serinicoccus chungangensis]KUG59298.1 hypothetical protein AVL62_06355 [Serinicoccus chungangensis]